MGIDNIEALTGNESGSASEFMITKSCVPRITTHFFFACDPDESLGQDITRMTTRFFFACDPDESLGQDITESLEQNEDTDNDE